MSGVSPLYLDYLENIRKETSGTLLTRWTAFFDANERALFIAKREAQTVDIA
jgi:hypothetical protein